MGEWLRCRDGGVALLCAGMWRDRSVAENGIYDYANDILSRITLAV